MGRGRSWGVVDDDDGAELMRHNVGDRVIYMLFYCTILVNFLMHNNLVEVL